MPEPDIVLDQIATLLHPDYPALAALAPEALAMTSWQTLGMQSLELAELVLQLEEACGCLLANATLARVSTFGELAAAIALASTGPESGPVGDAAW